MNVCSTCKYTCKGKYPCREVKPDERKPVTNGDRIRAMTDEELAKYLHSIRYAWSCPIRTSWKRCYEHNDNCYDCWLEWLKQEASE